MAFFSKLLPDGITARLCRNEPNCRVKPFQIEGNVRTSPLTVSLFVEDGDILGVAVSDLDSLDTVANVGETWNDEDETEKVDALSGKPMLDSGWTLTRRLDGEEWNFRSLTGFAEALKGGMFGVTLINTPTLLGEAVDDDDPDEAEDDVPCTCESCVCLDAADVTWAPVGGAALTHVTLDEFVDGFIRIPGAEPQGFDPPEFARG